jgi:hypothetical protein
MKKLAIVLILVLLCNSALWSEDLTVVWIAGGIGMALLFGLGLFGILANAGIVEADQPDDGIRMVSMQNLQSVSDIRFLSVMEFLQHIDVGVTPEKRAYFGLRFRF